MRPHILVPFLLIALALAGCSGLPASENAAAAMTAASVPTYALAPAGTSEYAELLSLQVPRAWTLPVYISREARQGCTLLVLDTNLTVLTNRTGVSIGLQRLAVVDGDGNRYPVNVENSRSYGTAPLTIESGFVTSFLRLSSSSSRAKAAMSVEGRLVSFVPADARGPYRLEYLEGQMVSYDFENRTKAGWAPEIAWYTLASAPIPAAADGLRAGARAPTNRSEDFGEVSMTVRSARLVDLPEGTAGAAGALLTQWNMTGSLDQIGHFPEGVVRYLVVDLNLWNEHAGPRDLPSLAWSAARDRFVLVDETGFFSYRPVKSAEVVGTASTVAVDDFLRVNTTYLVLDVPGTAYSLELRGDDAKDDTATLIASAPVSVSY